MGARSPNPACAPRARARNAPRKMAAPADRCRRAARGDRGGRVFDTGLRRCAHSNDRRAPRRAHRDDPRQAEAAATAEGCSHPIERADGVQGREPARAGDAPRARGVAVLCAVQGRRHAGAARYLGPARGGAGVRGTSAWRAARGGRHGRSVPDGGGGDRGSARRGARARARGERDGHRASAKRVGTRSVRGARPPRRQERAPGIRVRRGGGARGRVAPRPAGDGELRRAASVRRSSTVPPRRAR